MGNVSETPTPRTCRKSMAVHLQFVRQHAPHLYRRAFLAFKLRRKGNPAIGLPFVRQYASHLYSGSIFHPQPPSLLILLPQPGSERKVLTKETWFSLLSEWKSWKLPWEQFLPDQVLLSKNFHSRPDCRREYLVRNSGVGGGTEN